MIGLLHGWFERWAVSRQIKELQQFVRSLSSMDDDEVGMVVACATHVRHQLEESRGLLLLFPAVEVTRNPSVTLTISGAIKQLQRENRPTDAAALMVWLHTVRAMYRADVLGNLRTEARGMWRELSRGFDHVEQMSVNMRTLAGVSLDIEGYRQIPDGLAPR